MSTDPRQEQQAISDATETLQQRIVELEAEKSQALQGYARASRELDAFFKRADKAEAENGRLRQVLEAADSMVSEENERANKLEAENERLRGFANRVWLDERVPGALHDAAAKILNEPSLAHGMDDESEANG